MQRYYVFLVLIISLVFQSAFAQEGRVNRATKQFDKYAYVKASDIYKRVAESGYESPELFKKLGDSYYFNANYPEAEQWYSKLFAIEEPENPIYFLRYARSLNSVGKAGESKTIYSKFIALTGSDESPDYESLDEKIEAYSGRYDIEPITINSESLDFGSHIHNDYFYFTSARDTSVFTKRVHSWNNMPFFEVYKAKIAEDGSLGDITKVKGDVNTRHHETNGVITKDGKTMYFTRTNITEKQKVDTKRLKIYRAEFIDDKWKNVEDLSINSDQYSNAHPALSPDEKRLYFASNRPGTKGFTDIYYAEIRANGQMGEVIQLGEHINTKGRESFPTINQNNELYFSSDGHYGLGGYDVFYVNLEDSQAEAINVGKPVNSNADDFAFMINAETNKGFFSSNRDGGLGYDDIYSFVETKPINTLFESRLFGQITDSETNAPLRNATVTVTDMDNNPIATITTDASGNYSTIVKRNTTYLVRADKDKYTPNEKDVTTTEPETQLDLALDIDEFEVKEGVDIALPLGIKEIYFDFDKYNIRPDAEVELQKVVQFLKINPSVSIDVRSHTDSRGNDAYNMRLSDNRAKSTVQYIIDQGIEASRISGRGYGESQLRNNCTNGVKCSKEAHQLNRRSEFVIVKTDN